MTPQQQLQQWIADSGSIVFFGGAGVSTESGIPDFRSVDGLYRQQYDEPPETILSHTYFQRRTADFYRFYRAKMLCLEAQPNAAHRKLAELEAAGKLKAVVTQNIDGLHQAAGSRRVWELHGSVHRNRCMRCKREYPVEAVAKGESVPRCECGGIIKPLVVLYEEPLEPDVVRGAQRDIFASDLLIVGGTSLSVYPAAGLVADYSGRIVLINKSPTSYDERAGLLFRESIGKVLGAVC